MFKKVIPLLCLLVLLICSTGCRTTTGAHLNWYPGTARPTNEVGLLKLQHDLFNGRCELVWKVDGVSIRKGAAGLENYAIFNNTGELELLPGTHTLEASYLANIPSQPHAEGDFEINFDCEAGHTYYLYAAPIANSKEFPHQLDLLLHVKFYLTAWIVDEQTGQVIAGRRFSKYFIIDDALTKVGSPQRGNRVTPDFLPQDILECEVAFQVDDPAKNASELKPDDVVFNWYADGQLKFTTSYSRHLFDGTTTTLSVQKPAFALGTGQCKVEVLIHGEKIASHDFKITR